MLNIKIFKGCHYSTMPALPDYLSKGWCYDQTIALTDSCKYNVDEPSLVNKLFGLSHGWFAVHRESDRFGWTYNAAMNNFTIYAYYYAGGKLAKRPIRTVEVNEFHTYSITYNDTLGTINYYIDDMLYHSRPAGNTDNFFRRFKLTLTPYFGGNSRAPHTMTIKFDI